MALLVHIFHVIYLKSSLLSSSTIYVTICSLSEGSELCSYGIWAGVDEVASSYALSHQGVI